MKKTLLLLLTFALLRTARSQNVGINPTGALPHPSAMLDVSSPNKGMLVPRTSTASRMAIANPAKGLMIYDTTTSTFWFHDGSAWSEIPKGPVSGGGGGSSPWALKDTNIYNINHGNVGIGTDSATEPLTIQTGDLKRGFSHRGANGKLLTSFMGDTFAEFATVSLTDLYLGCGGFPHVILQAGTGNVAINYPHPTNIFQVGGVDSNIYRGYHIAFGDGTHSSGLYQGSQMLWTSNTNMHIIPKNGSGTVGTVGINTYEEYSNKLQIGNIGTTGYNGNDIAFGNGTQAGGLTQMNDRMQVASSTDMSFIPQNGSGHVGINTTFPITNTLQIGKTGGFAGNDIAFGNGTQVTGIAQANNRLQIGSTTDIVFLPQYGTNHGRVGINTASPLAVLDVANTYTVPALSDGYSYVYEYKFDGDHNAPSFLYSPTTVSNISILTQGNIYCNELDVYSDLRIKNLIGTSDAAKDLASVNAIRIRDYTMKDKLKYGNRRFKKVIAQELEKVYPDLVSQHTDFIPNVYRLTDSVTKVDGGYSLHFNGPHHLGDTARRLKALLTVSGNLETFNIMSIPSANEVVIDAPAIKSNRVFVYGEQISDFRTVDYEGLTTLNISATQEIGRTVQSQAETIGNLQKEIDLLSARMAQLEKTTPRRTKNKLSKGGFLALRTTSPRMTTFAKN